MEVVGRDVELATIRDFATALAHKPAALVIHGAAGLGKTTLWTSGVVEARERGFRVLEARPAESETALSFSAIGDLFEPVMEEALAALPELQRRALSRALVLDDEPAEARDAYAVSVAFLNAIRALTREGPLVIAVDDVQWLDPASSAGLAYAARRLRVETAGLFLTRRSGLESVLLDEVRRSSPSRRVVELELGPLDAAGLHHVVLAQLGVSLPRPLLAEVRAASAGNPFYALEIVRMLLRTGASMEPGQPLPLPESLRELVHGRLLVLPPESRLFLAAAAAHAQPTVATTEAAAEITREVGLPPALEAAVVHLQRDRIRFAHPLFAAGAYETVDPLRRTEIHARLAELLEDPEARAWQLAASVSEPDERVARTLERAANHARARGSPRSAALLLERAHGLTPSGRDDDELRRAVDAAYFHYESGDSPRAEAQLRDVIAAQPAGGNRARALTRLARVRSYEAQAEAADLFVRAVEEAQDDKHVLAVAHEGVATCLYRLYERLPEAVEHAGIAAGLALELGDEPLAAEALGTRWGAELALGLDHAAQTGQQALAIQPKADDRRVLAQVRFARAAGHLFWSGALEEARAELIDMLRRSSELGDESSLPTVLGTLGQVEYELGLLESAHARALEGEEASRQAGQRTLLGLNLAVRSFVDVQLGRLDDARVTGQRALELVPETGGRHGELIAARALAQLDLVLGAPDKAAARLAPVVEFVRDQGVCDPGTVPFVIDYVEALILLNLLEPACEVLDWYEANASRLGRGYAMASARRCAGLVAATSGSLDGAVAAYRDALEWHARSEFALDRARTLLALGVALRRTKRRRQARETLEQALASFVQRGAAVWADRTRDELRRISGRAPMRGALTPAEERVAALVADGKTNREVAAALFLSERTVEGHLSRVFAKLGVRSRNEVADALASVQN